jgi:N-succinyldiaminopimelate aminotransferase
LNPRLDLTRPYPFERLRQLLADSRPPAERTPINLSIGEPRHPTPRLVLDALAAGGAGLAHYPMTLGPLALREAIAAWLARRHGIAAPDPATEVLPVLGSREALFSFAQSLIDESRPGATVVMPNPFYQIYEGAALLAGALPCFVNADERHGWRHDWAGVPEEVWRRTQLLYVCSPDTPTGRVIGLDEWRSLFELADRHGFAIASDECYSEVHFDEAHPPLGALAAAARLGRRNHDRVVVFGSLSKRSNAPGLRSGYVAGDPSLIAPFLRYRTYHGSAMSPAVVAASLAAWQDEEHVRENRRRYAAKFDALTPAVSAVLPCGRPEAAFYLWARVPGGDDAAFTRDLHGEENVMVLPGSYIAREANGVNPGRGRIRIALVADEAECAEGIERIVRFATRYPMTGPAP